MLRLLGKDVARVVSTVGPEQEYFLIDEEDYAKRPDLVLDRPHALRRPPAKGQQLEDHYFGAITPHGELAFMKELDDELWKLGIPAKTKHNEVAPAQHELAPVFDDGQRRHRPQPADHGAHEDRSPPATAWSACCTRSPSRASTARASTTTGPLATDDGRTCSTPATRPTRTLQFLAVL